MAEKCIICGKYLGTNYAPNQCICRDCVSRENGAKLAADFDGDMPPLKLKDSGNRREFETGAVRDMGGDKGRCDLLPACAILRLAKHYEAGARKYTERNWEKGIPISSMIDSATRHILKYLDGQTDEDHLVAAAWNIMGAMWMEEKKPEMQDIPTRHKCEGGIF